MSAGEGTAEIECLGPKRESLIHNLQVILSSSAEWKNETSAVVSAHLWTGAYLSPPSSLAQLMMIARKGRSGQGPQQTAG